MCRNIGRPGASRERTDHAPSTGHDLHPSGKALTERGRDGAAAAVPSGHRGRSPLTPVPRRAISSTTSAGMLPHSPTNRGGTPAPSAAPAASRRARSRSALPLTRNRSRIRLLAGTVVLAGVWRVGALHLRRPAPPAPDTARRPGLSARQDADREWSLGLARRSTKPAAGPYWWGSGRSSSGSSFTASPKPRTARPAAGPRLPAPVRAAAPRGRVGPVWVRGVRESTYGAVRGRPGGNADRAGPACEGRPVACNVRTARRCCGAVGDLVLDGAAAPARHRVHESPHPCPVSRGERPGGVGLVESAIRR